MQNESQSYSPEGQQGTETRSRTKGAQSEAYRHSEGPVARQIEDQTARVPSDAFLWAALGTMAVAATFQFLERKQWSLFLGQWAAPLLLFGLYNKLVKVAGSDRIHSGDGSGASW
jgi:hypothetical protein